MLDLGEHAVRVVLEAAQHRAAEHAAALGRRDTLPQYLTEPAVLDGVAERRHTFLIGFYAHGAEAAALGYVNRDYGLRVAVERAPQSERGEDSLRAVRERGHARIEARL